jgi:hypothetical protein
MVVASGAATTKGGGAPGDAVVFGVFEVILGLVVLAFLAKIPLLAYSGICIRRRRHRMLSVVLACLACLNVPLGTMLGVFTLVMLTRPSVKALYGYR